MRVLGLGFKVGAVLFLSACAYGAPLGFSSGDVWTAPLVGPLENNELVVPVKINDHGPYLFVIDPDSPVSVIDTAIRSEVDSLTLNSSEVVDERDRMVHTWVTDLKSMQIGPDLRVRGLRVWIQDFGIRAVGGRLVRGVIGRDVLADSMIFGVDRDRGQLTIATQGHLAAPAGAARLRWRGSIQRVPRRRLVGATVNGRKMTMHIDLGTPFSQLWPARMDQLALPRFAIHGAVLVDELGTRREIGYAGVTATIAAGGVDTAGLWVVPYDDRRTRDVDLDGALGCNFFAGHNLVVNNHTSTLHMSPRAADPLAMAAERMGRWGAAFERCRRPACVEASVVADSPDGSAAPGAAYTLFVRREATAPARDYDVLLEAVDAQGKPLGLPHLLVSLPAGQSEVVELAFDAAYAAASFRVLDASPFARPCKGNDCVFQLALRR